MPFKFVYISDLLERLESLELQDRDIALRKADKENRYHTIIEEWFQDHRKLIDSSETNRVALLSSLFPERRTDRVYWLQPPSLVKVLCRCLGFGTERLQRLKAWTLSNNEDLASWVANIVKATDPGMAPSNTTIEDIDKTLERLAARCRFSGPQVQFKLVKPSADTAHSLLKPLINQLPSHELKWFLRLILKNYHPVVLEEQLVLRHVHFLLPKLLRFQSSFDAAARVLACPSIRNMPAQPTAHVEEQLIAEIPAECLRPQVGVKIGRPSFVKARSIHQCLQLTKNSRWTVEPKFDGEYCQVHIDLLKGRDCIQIFAKSGKDATQDRQALHNWIRHSLRIGSSECKFKQKCILEGEMVVYDEKLDSISEFHKIRKHVSRAGSAMGTENDSQAHPYEHLTVVFFDALLIDDEVTMALPYCERRRKLKELVLYLEGCIESIEGGMIDFSNLSEHRAMRMIQRQFSKSISRRFEGLMLKPYDGPYLTLERPANGFGGFIKMKKDYIPGLGDSTDFAVVGASRDTKVQPIPGVKWNRFAIACICNKDDVLRFGSRPVFRVLDSLSRPCISENDARYISNAALCFGESLTNNEPGKLHKLVITEFEAKIDVQFIKPFIVEVLGSGFDKPPSKGLYFLRHPRIIKIHGDRGVEDVVSFDELQAMAHEAINLPANLALEESKWRQALEKASRPKRSVYTTNQSPFSSKFTTSPSSTASSRRNVMQRHEVQSMIRTDSSELLPGETRELPSPPRAHAAEDYNTTKSLQLLTLPPESAVYSIAQEFQGKNQSESLNKRESICKRKRDVGKTSLTGQERNTEIRRNKTVESKALNLSLESLAQKKGPLADITNTASESISAGSSHTTFYDARSDCILPDDSTRLSANFMEESQDSFRSVVSQSDQTRTVEFRKIEELKLGFESRKDLLHHDMVTSNFFQNVGTNSQARQQRAGSELRRLESHLSNLLKQSVIYISPCLQGTLYLTEDLLPNLSPAQTIRSLSHWTRDLLYLPPSSPVVGESQAYVGLQKLVLVETRRRKQTDEVIERLRGLKLSVGEEIKVWDWRMCEFLVELMRLEGVENEKSFPPTDENGSSVFDLGTQEFFELKSTDKSRRRTTLVKRLSSCYFGKLIGQDRTGKSSWRAARDWMTKSSGSVDGIAEG